MRTTANTFEGVGVGLVASWVKALSEPPLQAAAERILPPSPAQKQEVGADPSGRPENMPPAVVVGRAAAALGHPGLSARERVRAQQVIHYGFGAALGGAYLAAASRWPTVTRVVEGRSPGSRARMAPSSPRSECDGRRGAWRRPRSCGSRRRTPSFGAALEAMRRGARG
jgi:hypothetical protein